MIEIILLGIIALLCVFTAITEYKTDKRAVLASIITLICVLLLFCYMK